MRSVNLINIPMKKIFVKWLGGQLQTHLDYLHPKRLAKELGVEELECYKFMDSLVNEGLAVKKVKMECPNEDCKEELIIDDDLLNEKYECDECSTVFIPNNYLKYSLNSILYEINKKDFLDKEKELINPLKLTSYSNEKKVINLQNTKENGTSLIKNELVKGGNLTMNKGKKIFISHSTEDEDLVKRIIRLLGDIGVDRDKEHIFCSSYKGLGVPVGDDISEYIRNEFDENIIVLFIMTKNFYDSPACLCEMGAAWVKSKKHIPLIVPPFQFKGIKGFINKDIKGIDITNKDSLYEFKETIEKEFGIEPSWNNWESDRDEFIDIVTGIISKNS